MNQTQFWFQDHEKLPRMFQESPFDDLEGEQVSLLTLCKANIVPAPGQGIEDLNISISAIPKAKSSGHLGVHFV